MNLKAVVYTSNTGETEKYGNSAVTIVITRILENHEF